MNSRLAAQPRPEVHLSHRSNWLRAAVLGANDGIVSTASLVLGVAAAGASGTAIATAGVAGLTAGALSMAAGEYVSVSSQRDSEEADLRLEQRELSRDPGGELRELAGIYVHRGLAPDLALQVAVAMSSGGALAAHARRARARRAAARSAVAGGVGVRAVLRHRSRSAAVGHRRQPRFCAGRRVRRRDAGGACPARRRRSPAGWRSAVAGNPPGPRLGGCVDPGSGSPFSTVTVTSGDGANTASLAAGASTAIRATAPGSDCGR